MWKMAAQLVKIPDVERLSPRVIRILGGNPGKFTLQGTNTYLIGTGPRRILIDTGEGVKSWKYNLARVLQEEKATIGTTLITHWHHDHTNGIHDVERLCPEAKFHKFARRGEKPTYYTVMEDEQEFSVEGATITAHHTPGHTDDHVVFMLKEEEAIFTGDNVLGQGTSVFEDLGVYMASLKKMHDLKPKAAYPAHGPFIEEAQAKITEYISHRKQREDQIIQVLNSDVRIGKTSKEIVKVIYVDVPEDLHPAAEGGVLKVLHKLEADKQVTQQEGGIWKLLSSLPEQGGESML